MDTLKGCSPVLQEWELFLDKASVWLSVLVDCCLGAWIGDEHIRLG